MSSADSATITLSRSGRQFSAAAGATLLGAAQQAGLILPYSCGTGRCSSCKGRVLSGHTEALQQETGLDPAEREAGWVLCCVRQAVGAVSLDIEDLTGLDTPPAQTLPCRIQALERLSHDVLRVTLRLPPNKVLDFLPGQYVEVIGEGGLRRAYSLASAPRRPCAGAAHPPGGRRRHEPVLVRARQGQRPAAPARPAGHLLPA